VANEPIKNERVLNRYERRMLFLESRAQCSVQQELHTLLLYTGSRSKALVLISNRERNYRRLFSAHFNDRIK